jgi:hypothetical protein
VVVLLIGSLRVVGQEKVHLREKRITIQMSQKSLYTIFNKLINKYDIAIGLEESALDRDYRDYYFETNVPLDNRASYLEKDYRGSNPETSVTPEKRAEYGDKEVLSPTRGLGYKHLITVDFKDARLEDVLDSIVRQMENYNWEINNDVVNIFPVRGRDQRLKKLLDTRVRNFAVGKGAEIGSIQAQLMLFLPEFKLFLEENNLEPETGGDGSVFEDRILPDGMSFSDLTFKELLNAITKSNRGGWMLQIKKQRDKPGKEFVEILI